MATRWLRASRRMPLTLAALLAGCDPMTDDPGNPPLLGRWQRETKLVTLVANDVWMDRKDAPFELPRDGSEIEACGEPTGKRRDEIARDLAGRTGQLCTLDTLEDHGTIVTSCGSCGPRTVDGAEITGTIDYRGERSANRIRGVAKINLIVRGRSGAAERIRAASETVWTRLGDCEGR